MGSQAGRWAKAVVAVVLLAALAPPMLFASAEASLPDGRAYELVSPPAKSGGDVSANSTKTHAASDGDGVVFNSSSAFGSVRGTAIDSEYLSRRTGLPGTSGWSTRGISPLGSPLTLTAAILDNIPTFEALFTPDLTAGIYKSWRPLTDAPNVADVSNLYRVSGLDANTPDVQLLTAGASPLAAVPPELKMFIQNFFNGASRDLRHVIFQSPWSLTGDGGFDFVGNLYEYADGAGVRLVSRIPSGTDSSCDDVVGPACAPASSSLAGIPAWFNTAQYSAGMISDDGSRIVFEAPAGSGAIYVREEGTRTYRLNASEKRDPEVPESPGPAQAWGMSSDGARVFFTTSEQLVNADDDVGEDLYMFQPQAPAGARLELLSDERGGAPADASAFVGASADGRYVYFVWGRLVLWHDGEIAEIGSFTAGEAGINTPRTTWNFITFARASRVTPDGRFLLFMSKSDAGFRGQGGFGGYDHGSGCVYGGLGPCRELYLYRADTGRLVCASCNSRSSVATGDALTDVRAGASGATRTQHLSHALSDDGRRVFFNTQEALVAEDSNGKWDAYMYDVPSASVHLISTGKDSADSYFLDASLDGDDVFFVTRERLVGWDIDDSYDLYDARVGGGFPDPAPPVPPCVGETCRAPAAAAPTAATGTSAHVRGAGDAAERLRKHKRCKRRAVLRRVRGKRRCVKRRARRRATRSGAQVERSAR